MAIHYASIVQSLNMLLHVSVALLTLVGLITNGEVLPNPTAWLIYFIVLFVCDLGELVAVVLWTRRDARSAVAAFTNWIAMYHLNLLHWVSDALVGFLLLVYFSRANDAHVLHWWSVTGIAVVAYWLLELPHYLDALGAYLRAAESGGGGSDLQKTTGTANRFRPRDYDY